jgi:PAS domain S-box-containing protein
MMKQNQVMQPGFISKLLVIGFLVFGYGFPASAEPNHAKTIPRSVLTEAQHQWLAERPNLRIGLTSIPPQVFRDEETGKLSGLCVDYISAVEKRLGYTFRKEYFKTWEEMMTAAEEGRIDVVYAAQQTPSRNEKFLFTRPYLEFQNMIVTCQDVRGVVTLESLSGKKVAVVGGASIEEDMGRQYPSIQRIPVEDELRGLLLVAFKEADAMVVEPARASYLISQKKITNLRVAGETKMYYRLGFAVRKDIPELQAILDAGLRAITPSEKTVIENEWIHLSPEVDLRWLWCLLAGCGVLILAVVAWSLSLHRQVDRRTVELREELRRRTLAEESHQQMEEQFRHVIEFCPLGVLMYRLENNDRLVFTAGNTAAEKILGIDLRPQLGKTLEEIFPELSHTDIPERYRKICKNGIPWETHDFHYKNEHTQGIFEVYAFQNSAGQLTVMFADITERIATRQAVEHSEALLKSIFRAAPVGIGFLINRTFKHVNDRFCGMLGYRYEEVIEQSTRMMYVTQEEYEKVGGEIHAQIQRSGMATIQTRTHRKDGVILDVLLCFSAIDAQDLSKGTSFIVMDNTDQIADRRSLVESQRMMATLIGNLPGIAYRCRDTDWSVEFISKGCRELTGYDENAFHKDTVLWKKLIHPEDLKTTMDAIQDAMSRREKYQREYRIRTADGQEKWVWEQGCGVMDDSGNLVAQEGLIMDITAHKQAERDLQFFQFAIEHCGEAAFCIGTDARIIYVNDIACKSLGYTREELLTMSIPDIDPYLSMERWSEYRKEAKEKKCLRFDTCHKSKEGQELPVEISSNFMHFGGTEYIYAFSRDIRERKRAEEQLRLNADRMEALLKINQMADASLSQIMDFALAEAVRLTRSKIGYLSFLNDDQTVLTMHVWPRSVMAEFAMTDKPHPYPVEMTGLWGEAIRQRKPVITNDYAAPNPLKKGLPEGHVPLSRHMNVPIIVRSKIVLVAGVGNKEQDYDQTDVQQFTLLMEGMWRLIERIYAEQGREKLMRELQAKNEELESIVFIASHDLRSPLINIQGFSGELQKSCRELTVLLGRETLSEASGRTIRRVLDEDIPESLSFISAGTGKMDALVKGLLRLARIGTVQMHIEPVDMNRLMATILKTVQYQMREYDIEIRAGDLPPCLGDWVQLNQVFSNLIDNAIKYRHPERKSVIEITAARQGARVRYSVCDNGIGIAQEHGRRIFEIFHRLNPAGPVRGEGLGLTIVQRILDRLDGKIDVESAPDKGAVFIVELPAVPEK